MGELKKMIYPNLDMIDRLDEVMRATGSDAWWGNKLRCDRKTVLHWRHGYQVMNLETFRRICDISGVSADWILFGEENEEEEKKRQ